MWVRDGRGEGGLGGGGEQARRKGGRNGLRVRDKRKRCLICGCVCAAGKEKRVFP